MNMSPDEFIESFKSGFDKKEIEDCFLYGNCWYFSLILMNRFESLNPEVYYDPVMNHFVTKIEDKFYDISGEVSNNNKYESWVEFKKKEPNIVKQIENDCILKNNNIKRRILMESKQISASEEIEFFNTDDEQYSSKDITMDDIISEKDQLKESADGYKVYISLVNKKPVYNESKNVDDVIISSNLFSENFEGKALMEMFVIVDEDTYDKLIDYSLREDKKFDSILIDKLNKREGSANILASQYIDAILCESEIEPLNKRVYSLYKGSLLNYDDMNMMKKVDNIKNDATFNESFDFYFNGFNKKEWLK